MLLSYSYFVERFDAFFANPGLSEHPVLLSMLFVASAIIGTIVSFLLLWGEFTPFPVWIFAITVFSFIACLVVSIIIALFVGLFWYSIPLFVAVVAILVLSCVAMLCDMIFG